VCLEAGHADCNDSIGYFVLGQRRQLVELTSIGAGSEDSNNLIPEGFNPGLFTEVVDATTQIATEREAVDDFGRCCC
jgi:hypothetical protein